MTDSTTLGAFVERIQAQYGRAHRIWVTDRGMPSEEVLASMHGVVPPVRYLVGTTKRAPTKLEQSFLEQPWVRARELVRARLLAQGAEMYVVAQCEKRAIRRRQLKKLIARLHEPQSQRHTYNELMMKVGAAKSHDGRAYGLVDIEITKQTGSRQKACAQPSAFRG